MMNFKNALLFDWATQSANDTRGIRYRYHIKAKSYPLKYIHKVNYKRIPFLNFPCAISIISFTCEGVHCYLQARHLQCTSVATSLPHSGSDTPLQSQHDLPCRQNLLPPSSWGLNLPPCNTCSPCQLAWEYNCHINTCELNSV